MLFVLVMEVLNRLLGWVEQPGLLGPVQRLRGYRVSLYADDLVLFVAPEVRDLHTVKAVLSIFGLSSGLFSNLDKSVAIPMHCSDVELGRIRDILDCRVEQFPCRYVTSQMVRNN
jgi:hypothetical protein